MSLITAQWHSNTLGMKVSTNLLLPDLGEGPFPVLYLLHGLSDDHTIWTRFTRLELYVRNLPLMVVMPQGFRGFYTRQEQGPDYATYIAEDLPRFVERQFHAAARREHRAIGGLSMGGYGALRIGLGYPQRYVSVHSHSGAFALRTRKGGPVSRKEFEQIFGRKPAGTDHDLRRLARRAKREGMLPKLWLDCGKEDFLIRDNRRFHGELKKMKIDHEYREYAGAHNWDYWDLHIRDALKFHCQAMGVTPY